MFKGLSTKLVDAAIQRNIIEPESKEENIYGLNICLTAMLNMIFALVIGLIMDMMIEMILFIVVFKSLRRYVGGAHSKNDIRCFISSCVTYVIALNVIKYYNIPSIITMITILICALVIFLIAPVEAEKKPLDEIEREVFGRRSIICLAIWLAIFLTLNDIPNVQYANHCAVVIAVGIVTVTVFAIEGKIIQCMQTGNRMHRN